MTISGYYQNQHQSQLGLGVPTYTRREGCTPCSGANGANASTGGRIAKTAQQVHALIPKSQETSPAPGWSLTDLDRAMAKLGVPFDIRSGQGWAAVIAALDSGHYVALQGDSDQFSDKTCSGVFDGNHCIGVHPAAQGLGSGRQRWIDDPLCVLGRWETEAVLRRYASKLAPSILFGVFTIPVPKHEPTHTVHIAQGARVRVYAVGGSGCILKVNGRYGVDTIWTKHDSKAPCMGPVPRQTCDGRSQSRTVLVTDGAFKGKHVGLNEGVTVT